MALPTLSPAAFAHLDGRPVVLRGSPRHGCCGGSAVLPVAEIGPPRQPERYLQRHDGDVTWFVEPSLAELAGRWTVDAVGFGRWRRLLLDGAEPLDLATTDRPSTDLGERGTAG
jgi:hypothetical protein